MNNRIDDILDRLQNESQPIIPDADALTDSIMDALAELDESRAPQPPSGEYCHAGKSKDESRETKVVPMWFTALRNITSIAAMLIVGVFIYNQFETTPNESPAYRQDISQSNTINILRRCYLESQNKQITYTQLKRMINENR